MSRLTNAILSKGAAWDDKSAALDLSFGGQNGHTHRIGKVGPDGVTNYSEWISNQAHVQQNIIPVVLDYPRGLDLMPQADKWIAQYNALMTLHPLTITGLQSGLTAEFDEHAIGAAGEMQEELTKVSRARSSVSMTYKEKNGKAIQKYIDMIMRYLYSDPDVEKPLITNIPGAMAKIGTDTVTGGTSNIYTADFYTGTNLYIEPDVTQHHVVDAWLTTNVMFKGNGDRTGERDTHGPRKTIDLSIELTGITMSNQSVRSLAATVLASLNATGTGVLNNNPDMLPLPKAAVDSKILSSNQGYNTLP